MSDKPEKTRVIAVEEHFSTNEYLDKVAALKEGPGEEAERAFMDSFIQNPKTRDRVANLSTMLNEMDQAGTDMSVLSLNPPALQQYRDAERATALSQEMNDRLVDIIQQHPTRFAGLGSLAPQLPDKAAQELKRAVGKLRLNGIMICSHTLGHYLDEPQFEPILFAAEEENATIYLHPRVPSPAMLSPYSDHGMLAALWGFQAEAGTHAMRLITSGVFDRHPKLKIVLGHLGEALPFWLWRTDNIYEHTYGWAGEKLKMTKLQLKPSEYLRRNFAVTTSGMNDPAILSYVLSQVGAENVLFAIDYPYEDSATATKFLAEAPLAEADRRALSHANAERLFRITPGLA